MANVKVNTISKVSGNNVAMQVSLNLKSITGAILILLMVGSLSGTWLISGIIPAMIYYGLKIINPSIFLPSCIFISAIVFFINLMYELFFELKSFTAKSEF